MSAGQVRSHVRTSDSYCDSGRPSTHPYVSNTAMCQYWEGEEIKSSFLAQPVLDPGEVTGDTYIDSKEILGLEMASERRGKCVLHDSVLIVITFRVKPT